jgi:hypothetical protein
MKNILITAMAFCAILILLCSCWKCTKNFMGKIIGFDATKCGCCGGYFMVINGDTLLTQTNLGEKLPMLNTADFIFPLTVNVAFVKETGNCENGKRIVVNEISVR